MSESTAGSSTLWDRAKGTVLGLKKKYLSPIKSKNVVRNIQERKQLKIIGSSAKVPAKPTKSKPKSGVFIWPE